MSRQHRIVTRQDTPAAKKRSSNPPPIDNIEDTSPTIPFPDDWFQTRDALFGKDK